MPEAEGSVSKRHQRSIADTEPAAQHGLRIELVGQAKTRSDGVRVIRGEQTIAASRAVAGVNHRAEESVGRRIRRGRTETDHAVMEFIQRLLKIPAQTVVQGQLARDLPAILRIQSPRSPAIKQRLSVAGSNAVVLAEQETGPGAADAGSTWEAPARRGAARSPRR